MTEQNKEEFKELEIIVEPFTIFMLIGPSRVGKSTFARSLQSMLENDSIIKPVVLSTDSIRSSLNDYTLFYQHSNFTETSFFNDKFSQYNDGAFEIFYSQLKALTGPGVRVPLLILDSTGLSETFRDTVFNIARTNQYKVHAVVFDFNKNFIVKESNIRDQKYIDIIDRQCYQLRKNVLPTLTQKKVSYRTIIKRRHSVDWATDITLVYPDDGEFITYEETLVYRQPKEVNVIVGDVHEDIGAFKELIHLIEERYTTDSSIDFINLYQIGDYLDKGNQTKETIEYLFDISRKYDESTSKIKLHLVDGNHENYVQKRLNEEIPPNPEHEEKWVGSLKVLESDSDLKNKFFYLRNVLTYPFFKLIKEDAKNIFINHAPCLDKYLGKTDNVSLKHQRNFRITSEDIRDDLKDILNEAQYNKEICIFGHVPHANQNLNYRNLFFIDTGSVHGGKLTALVYEYDTDSDKPIIIQVSGNKLCENQDFINTSFYPKKEEKPFNIKDYDLGPRDERQIRRFVKSEALFISGTMSPAGASDMEIEPVTKALEYYANVGVKEVIITPKYMGSRGQMYLYRNTPEKDFMTSRSGVIIDPNKHEFVNILIEKARNQLTSNYSTWDSVIIDGEITPWSALGSSLIERDYFQYTGLIASELAFQSNHLNEIEKLDFGFDFNTQTHTTQTESFQKFFKQLSLYGGATDQNLDFKFFNFLKFNNAILGFKQYSRDFAIHNGNNYVVGDPSNSAFIENAKEFFERLTVMEFMEGVVLRPHAEQMRTDIAPYLKVRNEEYLRLIYGYDYKSNYEEKLKSKNVNGKIKLSIKEANIGLALLTETDKAKRTELAVKMFFNIQEEKKLDPRL